MCALERESAGSHIAAVPAWRYCLPYTCRARSALPAVCNTKISLLFISINCFNIKIVINFFHIMFVFTIVVSISHLLLNFVG